MTLTPYLPQDRLRAISRGETLPDRTTGSAMLADISGFTPLTEKLQQSLGPRRGAEELTRHLNAVFSALIAEVERYGGSVIGFAGDSITCWFDREDGDTARRATAAAFVMQVAMGAFTTILLPNGRTTALSLKVAIASGPARRFVVGDPAIHYVDALAGATVERSSSGEHLANKGEIVLDQATVEALGEILRVKEWRSEREGSERFAVAETLTTPIKPPSLSPPLRQPPPDQLQTWLPYAIRVREQLGPASFQTEFRPCTVLFIRFCGIDYEKESSQEMLNDFISVLQATAEQYEAVFMQLTIGDKGSYAHLNFGALQMHEDNARRAVRAALDILASSDLLLQVGIAAGPMRVGTYGSETRKTFGVMGDDVNLAARLMTTAETGEILVSGLVQKSTRADFTFEPRSPLPMKGKAEPLAIFTVTGERKTRAVRLQEPNYALPMVGRQDELKLIDEKLDLAAEGQSQVIGVVAEAGLGKSRLIAEVIRSARRKGFAGFGGACQSDGIHTPYFVWKPIWQAFFDVDPEMPARRVVRLLEGEIEDRAPSRLDAMPLLNVVLDLDIQENDFTINLEPKIRQSALHALLEDCLKVQANDEPTLIVIEDLHWIDALSHDLLESLAKALAHHAVCFVLAYRPPQLERLQNMGIEALPQFTCIDLYELTNAEAESAIRAKLIQLYPARGGALPAGLVEALMVRAQGNPFYLEELLNYVRDRGLDPADIESIELPDSLHTLILSRIDQLHEGEKTTLRVASIVGRLFRARWLTGYYPELGSFKQMKAMLNALKSLDITLLDSPEPELTYLFKHIVTHEVTYESLPFATRAKLHEQLARYLENEIQIGAMHASSLLDTIAFHYLRSENKEKQIVYLHKAGESAQKNYANDAAMAYYGQLLHLLKDANEQAQIHLKRGRVLEFMGKWDEAERDYRTALEAAKDDLPLIASAQFALGKLFRLRGEHEPALNWLGQAMEVRTGLGDTAGLAQVWIETGLVLHRKGAYEQAREHSNRGLVLASAAGDRFSTAQALSSLGHVAYRQGDYAAARASYEGSLALSREIGDQVGVAASLNNLGNVAYSLGDYGAVRANHEESLALKREMGDKWGIAMSLNNLGNVAIDQGDFALARVSFEESLVLFREMGGKWGIAMSLSNLGTAALAQSDYAAARKSYAESLILCKEMDEKTLLGYALLGLGLLDLAEQKIEARENILQSLKLRLEIGEQLPQTSSLIGVAGLVLQDGDAQFAAQLLGATQSAIKVLNAIVEVDVKFFFEQTLAKVKETLGEAAFQSAWDEGVGWTLEEAVAEVLEEE